MKKKTKIILSFIIILLFLFLFVRKINKTEIDDVNPLFENSPYINQVDILWIIPKFENYSISENKTWCEYILSLNKTLGLHGVYHTYKEFDKPRSQEYLNQGITEFEKCFNYTPTLFKPPQIAINSENKKLIKENNLKLKLILGQITHKVYHTNDTGIFPNWFIDIF